MFLADRYVCGTCPHCSYEDARGDQCDSCSKLLDAVDLKDSKCAICSSKPEIRDTTHIYINLPDIQPALE
jgi:methionyl-tRNA synthetase